MQCAKPEPVAGQVTLPPCRRRDDVVTEATEFPSGEPGTFRLRPSRLHQSLKTSKPPEDNRKIARSFDRASQSGGSSKKLLGARLYNPRNRGDNSIHRLLVEFSNFCDE